MCEKCDEINVAIERYKRLKGQVSDKQAQDGAGRLIKKLEAQKLALHSEKGSP